MQNIDKWLKQFTSAWKTYDIDKVLNLFTENVEYWENPFKKLSSLDEVRKEWHYIKKQKDIHIECKVFINDKNKHVIKWHLKYTLSDNKQKEAEGIYLIKLNSQNKCDYFYHCGEQKYE